MDRPGLLRAMETAYGSIAADGHWSLRNAYDVLELAQVLHLATLDLPQEPAECLAALTALTASLPTHTVRSEEQIALQQFSTPAAIGYLAALAVRITTADTVLEPSAGTGLLAVFAARAGAKLVLNEIDPARADMLQAAFPTAPVSRHDGELINDLLPLSIRPTAVLINPPFSRSIGRHADPLAAFRHLRAALKRLDAGGRCAAILPDRVDTSSRAWAKATEGCAIALHVELPANAYAKHGTSQIVKLIVLEKGFQDDVAIVRCSSLAEALATIIASAAGVAENPRLSQRALHQPVRAHPCSAVSRADPGFRPRSARPPSLSAHLISVTTSLPNPYLLARRSVFTCRTGRAASPFPVHPRIRPLWWNRSPWARLRHRSHLTFRSCRPV
ncbi:MAG: hypothetical protein AB7G25_05720 [Sphingomonadaceae bacterium]